MFDEFERMINNIQSSFLRGSFFDDEIDTHFRGGRDFFGGIPFIRDDDFNNFDNFSHNVNFHITPNGNNFDGNNPGVGYSDYQRGSENRTNFTNFSQGNQFFNQAVQNEPIKEIKYRDSKIYDV
jgi:hypothetical protein